MRQIKKLCVSENKFKAEHRNFGTPLFIFIDLYPEPYESEERSAYLSLYIVTTESVFNCALIWLVLLEV